jgi:acyl carrier protein
MTRADILALMNTVMAKRGRPAITDEGQTTRDANFRSLDFSETALRIETKIGRELAFDAASMRRIETVKDVLDFFEDATKAA